jgi:hypothetical protein
LNDNNITIDHRGGKGLDLQTKFIVTINGTAQTFIVNDYLTNKSKDNNVWNIGEKVVCPIGSTLNKIVSVSVVDVHSNSIIVMVDLQKELVI